MAAALNEINSYFQNILLIGELNVRNALNNQGLISLHTLHTYTDEDIKQICKNCKAPGGLLADGNPNRGVALDHTTAKSLRMMRFHFYHKHRIRRAVAAADHVSNNLDSVTRTWALFEQVERANEEDIDEPSPIRRIEDIRECLENLDDYLARKHGASGIPLCYVTREHVEQPERMEPAQADPGFGLPSVREELIRRARHDLAVYQEDSQTIWVVIRTMCHGGPAWPWVQDHARTLNGRDAYFSLKGHYLGPSFQSRIKARADQILETVFYDGKARNFSFEKFGERLKGAFTDLETNDEGITEARKIRVFLRGIRDPSLAEAKATILATQNLRTNFERAFNYVAEFVDSKDSMQSSLRQISAMNGQGEGRGRGGRGSGRGGRGRGRSGGRAGRGGRGRGGRGRGSSNSNGRSSFDSRNPGRYYSPAEWNTLSMDERQKARDSREDRDKRKIAAVIEEYESQKRQRTDTGAATGTGGIGGSMNRR